MLVQQIVQDLLLIRLTTALSQPSQLTLPLTKLTPLTTVPNLPTTLPSLRTLQLMPADLILTRQSPLITELTKRITAHQDKKIDSIIDPLLLRN